MRNQLRAGAYLLVRNPYVWAALALVVVRWTWCVVRVAQGGLSFGLQDSILRDKLTLLAYLLSAAGIAAFDQRGGALRGSCDAERGRERYAASRFVLVAVTAVGLVAVTALLDALGGAIVPGASRVAASPQMHEPARLAAGVLSVLVACELAFFLGTLARSRGVLATMGLLAVLFLAVVAVGALLPGASGPLDAAMPTAGFLTGVSFRPEASLMPLDLVRVYLVPVAWLAALFALTRLLLARRAV